MARYWVVILVMISLLLIFYNMLNLPVLSTRYTRYQLRELEYKNNIMNLKLDITHRRNVYALNNTYNEAEMKYTTDYFSYDGISKCEVIHIAMVCAGYKSSRSVVTLLKSILFYRKHPLHFHIMTDEIARKILSTLFDTWDIPQVNVSFYSASFAIPLVNWIPNNHYSGVYGLLKLTLPKLLPKDISKIIVLDTDLTFTASIADLWLFFSKFNKKQAIGLVENQSDWYLGKVWRNYRPWPAVGRGFNTGVILLDLKRLNEIGWPKLWATVAERTLVLYSTTRLADQDIFNAVIKQRPELVYHLPCQWNVQLSDHTLSESCYEHFDVKIIHWNSPRKMDVKNKHANYFKSIYYTFLEFNGNLLRRNLYACNQEETSTKTAGLQICKDFRQAQSSKWRTHIFIREFSYEASEDEVDITLVAQLSVDRLQIVEELCKHWEGTCKTECKNNNEHPQFSNYE